MKINKILLYNFNSFEGVNEFDLGTYDDGRNIILIGGKNGAGKTSLFTAIKIALYGPLAYGYVGMNSRYIAKVKECINSKAFQTDKVEARVQLTISLMIEREVREYVLTREWDYSGQKLVEKFSVLEDGRQMDKQGLSYFQNYLLSLIPPDLFEFFLFDGEAVGSIFSSNAYNRYVKNAVYTLCGLDVYEIIRKYTAGYVGKAGSKEEEAAVSEYENLRRQVESLEETRQTLEQGIAEEQEEIEKIDLELLELQTAFKNAGGISSGERNRLIAEFEDAERDKAEASAKIKAFMEELMPFYIVKNLNEPIKKQLKAEEELAVYQYVQQSLDKNELHEALDGKVAHNSIDELLNVILGQFKPKEDALTEGASFDLSREETSRVTAVMDRVEKFDAEDMISAVQRRKASSDKTTEINRILKNSMAEEDVAEFTEREFELQRKKDDTTRNLYEDRNRLEELDSQRASLTVLRDKAKQNLLNNVQNRHVSELSDGLSSMMQSLLTEKSASIKRGLEERIEANLKLIYRKDNLITHIELDDDFQINLYQDAAYSAEELRYLMKNLGKEGFSLAVGKTGMEKLFAEYGVNSLSALSQALKNANHDRVELYKNIDLSRLSKGERQIFILSLYWAVIEISGKDIPFVIDTPYARIDANHRKEISEKFFPRISRQVIILSTDEEVNEEYYEILKPYIAREYLLINDENQNRTTVEQRYFFGERL